MRIERCGGDIVAYHFRAPQSRLQYSVPPKRVREFVRAILRAYGYDTTDKMESRCVASLHRAHTFVAAPRFHGLLLASELASEMGITTTSVCAYVARGAPVEKVVHRGARTWRYFDRAKFENFYREWKSEHPEQVRKSVPRGIRDRISVDQVAREYGVNRKTLRDYLRRGKIRGIKIKTKRNTKAAWYLRRQDVQTWIDGFGGAVKRAV